MFEGLSARSSAWIESRGPNPKVVGSNPTGRVEAKDFVIFKKKGIKKCYLTDALSASA